VEGLFDEVADIVRGLAKPELGEWHFRPRHYGIKVWFDADAPTREHYEAQVISPRGVKDARTCALEIGFHSEYPKTGENDAVISVLTANERRWRKALGNEAEVGPFIGRADVWRRVSETWPDPDLDAPDLALEIALRLVDYVIALEPVRRARVA